MDLSEEAGNSDRSEVLYSQNNVTLNLITRPRRQEPPMPGTLSIIQHDSVPYLEWKRTAIKVDSDTHEQEWAVVTVDHSPRQHNRERPIIVHLENVKSISQGRCKHIVTFTFKDRSPNFVFGFRNANSELFLSALDSYCKVSEKMHISDVDESPESQLRKSFAELKLYPDNTHQGIWSYWGQMKERPYETTLDVFSKISDVLLYKAAEPEEEQNVAELLSQSLNLENTTALTNDSGEYELIEGSSSIALPELCEVHRGPPLSVEQWAESMDKSGRIRNEAAIKSIIFRGGVCPSIRYEVWKFLLGFHPWNSTFEDRESIRKVKTDEYYHMKQQWQSMTPGQEDRFSDFKARKSLIEKDVKRTDRTIPFFEGDDNPNLDLLNNILMTYVMYNFDLGYVQGMSDLLSPLLQLLNSEVETFWCFVGFMDRIFTNFEMDQSSMKRQLQQVHTLLSVLNPKLTKYLNKHESGNMFFCFRWLLVLFKREFVQEDILRLWEVLWSDLPGPNFHLLFCAAILDTEKDTFYNNEYGFTEILKHVNELSCKIDLDQSLCKAEALYDQLMKVQEELPNVVRVIIGLEPLNPPPPDSDDELVENDSSIEAENISSDPGETGVDQGC